VPEILHATHIASTPLRDIVHNNTARTIHKRTRQRAFLPRLGYAWTKERVGGSNGDAFHVTVHVVPRPSDSESGYGRSQIVLSSMSLRLA
jgi:hypothetical protein